VRLRIKHILAQKKENESKTGGGGVSSQSPRRRGGGDMGDKPYFNKLNLK